MPRSESHWQSHGAAAVTVTVAHVRAARRAGPPGPGDRILAREIKFSILYLAGRHGRKGESCCTTGGQAWSGERREEGRAGGARGSGPGDMLATKKYLLVVVDPEAPAHALSAEVSTLRSLALACQRAEQVWTTANPSPTLHNVPPRCSCGCVLRLLKSLA